MSLRKTTRFFPRHSVAIAVAFVTLVSCGDPTGISDGGRIPLDKPVEARVNGDTVRSYYFAAPAGSEYTVTLTALQGVVQLDVRDSASGNFGVSVFAEINGQQTADAVVVVGSAARVLLFTLRTFPGAGPSRAQFVLSQRELEPEQQSASFAIGDSIVGESMDGAGDIDVFTAQGTPGQEFVLAVDAPSSSTPGVIQVRVVDLTTGGGSLSFVHLGLNPPQSTLGTLTVPASGSIAVRFETPNVPHFRGAYRFWTYPVNRAPEQIGAPVTPSSVIAGERIQRAGDVDEFTFPLAAGQEFTAFMSAGNPFPLHIAAQGDFPFGAVVDTAPADTGMFGAFTPRLVAAQGGTHVARVTGSPTLSDTGAYRVYIYPVDRRPAQRAAAIVAGDTISGEAVNRPGDIDEFTFSASAGDEFNAFLQAQDGSANTRLQLEAVDADGTVLGTAYSPGNAATLLSQVTGTFTMRSSGTHRLRVGALQQNNFGGNTGPYRLLLYRVNKQPETQPPTLGFTDSVSGESIETPGDVDEFQVVVPAGYGASLFLQHDGTVPMDGGSLRAHLVDSAGTVVLATNVAPGPRTGGARLRVLSPGNYRLRVEGQHFDNKPLVVGPYRAWLYRFSLRPETAVDTFVIGDTVSSESLEPFGDEDVFHFYGVRHQQVNLAFQGLASAAGGMVAGLSLPGGGPGLVAMVMSGPSSAPLGDRQTLRIDLPMTGWYTLGVAANSSELTTGTYGPYRFTVSTVSSAVENNSAALVPGDTVNELLDAPGDLDEFTITGTPGQLVAVEVESSVPVTGSVFPVMQLFDPVTGDSLDQEVSQSLRILGPVPVPAGGQLLLRALEIPFQGIRFCGDAVCNGVYRLTGNYTLRVATFSRGPENVPSTYVLGDTIKGEALDPFGDVDEYTVTGTPGAMLSPSIKLLSTPLPAGSTPGTGGMVGVHIVNPATGAVLLGNVSFFGVGTWFTPGQFVVPPGGTFIIRIRGTGGFAGDLAKVPYQFFMAP